MSGKRGPKLSSFTPTRGFAPCRLMWSRSTTSAPCWKLGIDASGGIGEDGCANTHAPKHTHGECHLACRVAFVEVDAALHCGHRQLAGAADHQPPRVSDCGRARKSWNTGVGDDRCVGQCVGEATQTRSEHDCQARTQPRLGKNEFGRARGANIIAGDLHGLAAAENPVSAALTTTCLRLRPTSGWPWCLPAWRARPVAPVRPSCSGPMRRFRRSGCRLS